MTPQHPLDRPVWNALTTRQQRFAVGNAHAMRFDGAFGVFAAMADTSIDCRTALAALVVEHGPVAVVEAEPPPPIAGLETKTHLVWQMMLTRLSDSAPPPYAIVPLTNADGPEMLALATLTKPGPFFARTHELGAFVGVRHEGVLVAMAGERMKPDGFTEVSGVCTAPDYRGRGYGGALIRAIAGQVLARGETPFLHAYAHNEGAINLYHALGFTLRREITMHVLTPP